MVTFKAGVPIEVEGIRIDYLSPTALGSHLEAALASAPKSLGLSVVPIEVLVYMKLVARRRKDLQDVVELLRAGADAKRVREYLQKHAPDHLETFEELYQESLE